MVEPSFILDLDYYRLVRDYYFRLFSPGMLLFAVGSGRFSGSTKPKGVGYSTAGRQVKK